MKNKALVIEVLVTAQSLIRTPDKWIQGEMAQAADGTFRYSSNPEAVCFCIIGAMNRAGLPDGKPTFAHDGKRAEAQFAGERVMATIACNGDKHGNLPAWNDEPTRTHAEVMALFDKAIQNVETTVDETH